MLEVKHPHIETHINDNSYVVETYSEMTDGTILFQPFISDKGEDNVIKKINSITPYGKPNFKKHGQPIYNLSNWIKNGAPAFGVRLMPEDATYANLVLNFQSAVDTSKKLNMNLQAVYEKKLIDKQVFKNEFSNAESEDEKNKEQAGKSHDEKSDLGEKGSPSVLKVSSSLEKKDELEWKNHNILGFRIKGRGKYGCNYAIKIRPNNYKSKMLETKCYDFYTVELMENGNAQIIEGPFLVSFYPEAINRNGESIFIEQIINTYSEIFVAEFNDDEYLKLIDDMKKALPTLVENDFDFVFGKKDEKTDIENVVFQKGYEVFEKGSGMLLKYGSDGELENVTSRKERLKIINELYKKLFSGELLPDVFNKRAFPIDVVLDAGFPLDVKEEIKKFSDRRQDIFVYYDCGIINSLSPSASANFRNTQFDHSTFLGSIFGQSRIIKDPYGISEIQVTFPYILAGIIPQHDKKMGAQFALAGEKYGNLGKIDDTKISYNPTDDQQDLLYTNQVNYAIKEENDEAVIDSQITMQKKLSSLSDINNVRALLRLIRQLEKLARKYKHEFTDGVTLTSYQRDLDSLAPQWISNRTFERLTLKVSQTKYEKQLKTARVNVDCVFNGNIENIIIDVNIGR